MGFFDVSSTALYSLAASIVFGLVSLFAYKLRSLTDHHRGITLSFFGGVAAAYVFLDLLPSLRQAGEFLKNVFGGDQLVSTYEDAIFLIVFIGFLIFFSLEHVALGSRTKKQAMTGKNLQDTEASDRLFAIHISNFAFLSAILSFVLIFEFGIGPFRGAIYTFAVSLHLFISNDSMLEHYKGMQMKIGRYIAAVIPLVGWGLSVLFPERISEAYVLLALISGVILYNSIKREVPSSFREGSLKLFLSGAAFYTVILIIHAIVTA